MSIVLLTAELDVRCVEAISEHVVVTIPEIDRIVATCRRHILDIALVTTFNVVRSDESTARPSILACRCVLEELSGFGVVDLKPL